jgi:hypothetical protein
MKMIVTFDIPQAVVEHEMHQQGKTLKELKQEAIAEISEMETDGSLPAGVKVSVNFID